MPDGQPMPPRGGEAEAGAEAAAGDDKGILLYYAYRPLGDEATREGVARWYETEAAAGLVGRVRVAFDGVNATLGGSMRQLRRHIQLVEAHPLLRARGGGSNGQQQPIDFKLARNRKGARNARCRAESGFDRLRVVSLGPHAAAALAEAREGAAEPAPHVSPGEFHRMLEGAGSGDGREVVLLDARNLYESRIGRFAPPGVPVLVPPVRQFSELPAWLDALEEAAAEDEGSTMEGTKNESLSTESSWKGKLKGKRIAMYCTGGVRCERLSAYIRSKGEGYQDVVQLAGGIQRYLEAFPDTGGFFRGKNFVFDERVAVSPAEHAPDHDDDDNNGSSPSPQHPPPPPPSVVDVVGACLGCRRPWDDYGARARCGRCRMLVLACDACVEGERQGGWVCERCCQEEEGKEAEAAAPGIGNGTARKEGRRARWKQRRQQGKGKTEGELEAWEEEEGAAAAMESASL